MPAASFWLYNWVRCTMIVAAAALKSCTLFCCAAVGSADTVTARGSRNCLAEAKLIARHKSIIKGEINIERAPENIVNADEQVTCWITQRRWNKSEFRTKENAVAEWDGRPLRRGCPGR